MREKIELPVPLDDVLKRYEKGEELREIASSIGLAERTLYRRLLENKDKWVAAQEGQALQRFESAKSRHAQAIGELEALKRQLDQEQITDAAERKWRLAHVKAVTEAYEKAMNRAEWELERLVSRIYGQKQDVGSGSQVQINIGITRDAAVHIDGKTVE